MVEKSKFIQRENLSDTRLIIKLNSKEVTIYDEPNFMKNNGFDGVIRIQEKEFENILPASISSMQKNAVYNKETSERIYELARLFGLGYDVFDSKTDFKNWLMTPSKSLGNKVPFELLDSSIGFEIVENEIVRIQYNVYS